MDVINNFLDVHRGDGLHAIIISDRDGVPLIKAYDESGPNLSASLSFISKFSLSADKASKLGYGRNKSMIFMYGNTQVLLFNNYNEKLPVILTLIASADANTGLFMNIAKKLEPLLTCLDKIGATVKV